MIAASEVSPPMEIENLSETIHTQDLQANASEFQSDEFVEPFVESVGNDIVPGDVVEMYQRLEVELTSQEEMTLRELNSHKSSDYEYIDETLQVVEVKLIYILYTP